MKVLYLDLGMGAAGDMLGAALYELLSDPEAFREKLNGLGIPHTVFVAEPSVKCGITGTHFRVLVDGEEEGEHVHAHQQDHEHEHKHSHDHEHEHDHGHPHEHRGMAEIEHLVRDHLSLPEPVREQVLRVYGSIAQAESRVHGTPISEIHFHELGTMDALADICAVCLLLEELKPDRIIASPVHVGSGTVRCAHGIMPVPAPATALLLEGIPSYSTDLQGELCTPTGAALLRCFVDEYGPMPVMRMEKVGYGMGQKDFERVNCVRACLGQTADEAGESILELSCNLDDMTGEELGYAQERLFALGAREVYTVPVYMKKNRPGIKLCVLCDEDKKESILKGLFRFTTTIGVRECRMERHVMARTAESVRTPLGTARCKVCRGYGEEKKKWEYEDMAALATGNDLTLDQVRKTLDS